MRLLFTGFILRQGNKIEDMTVFNGTKSLFLFIKTDVFVFQNLDIVK